MKIKKIIPFYLINLVFHKMAIQHERSLLMMMSKIHNNKKKKSSAPTNGHIKLSTTARQSFNTANKLSPMRIQHDSNAKGIIVTYHYTYIYNNSQRCLIFDVAS
jgi:hypothetical protein